MGLREVTLILFNMADEEGRLLEEGEIPKIPEIKFECK